VLGFIVIFIFLQYSKTKKEQLNTQKTEIITYDSNHRLTSDSVQIITLKEFKSKDLYVKNCKFCHGETGKGDGIKARLDTDICPFDLTKETNPNKVIYYVILNGKDKMPTHKEKLTDDKINILVIYIKKFKK
jgi:hypothetical protein